MRNLLIISETWYPAGSGGELATHLIADLLRRHYELIVVTGTPNPAPLPRVKFIYTPLLNVSNKQRLWLNIETLVRQSWFKKLLRQSDAVYIPRFAFPIISYAKRLGKRVVVHLHGYIPISYTAVVLAPAEYHLHRVRRDDIQLEKLKGLKYGVAASAFWWMPQLARRWLRQADTTICVSYRQAEIIRKAAPEFRDKITVVYNPPPPMPDTPKKISPEPLFLYVGGESYIKGFHILLNVIKVLLHQRIRGKLLLAGNYSKKSILFARNNKLLKVLGPIPHSDVLKLHKEVWGLLFPSIVEEPMPYAVLEAAIYGTIPIAFKVGGVEEIVSGTKAQRSLIDPLNVEAFVQKIQEVAEMSPDEVGNISHDLREKVRKKFSIEEIEQKLLRIFD